MDYKSFDYGTVNVECDEWYGTLSGGGHTQSECLSFCQNDKRCFYATYYAESGYCHTSAVTCKYVATTHDNPITYQKTMHNMNDLDVACPTCPPTTTTKEPCTTTAPATTTTTTAAILPTSGFFEAYNTRMKDTCTGIAEKPCHDGTVQQQGSLIGYVLQQPISGFTDELYYAYSSRIQDTCTGTAGYPCHDGSVNEMGSSTGFILKNPIEGKTTPLYAAYSSRMQDTCTGQPASQCHDGTVQGMGKLLGHMPATQSITLQDIQGAVATDMQV